MKIYQGLWLNPKISFNRDKGDERDEGQKQKSLYG
jgi:hypothetical protein